jgi:hypothetical protein
MVAFIMELTGCPLDQVPEKLVEWMRTTAIGTGGYFVDKR